MKLPFPFSNTTPIFPAISHGSSPGCAGRNEHGMTIGATTLALPSLTPNLRSEMSMQGRFIDIRLFPRNRHDKRRPPPAVAEGKGPVQGSAFSNGDAENVPRNRASGTSAAAPAAAIVYFLLG